MDAMSISCVLSDPNIFKCLVDTRPTLTKKAPRKAHLYRKAHWEDFRTHMQSFCGNFMSRLEGKSLEQQCGVVSGRLLMGESTCFLHTR